MGAQGITPVYSREWVLSGGMKFLTKTLPGNILEKVLAFQSARKDCGFWSQPQETRKLEDKSLSLASQARINCYDAKILRRSARHILNDSDSSPLTDEEKKKLAQIIKIADSSIKYYQAVSAVVYRKGSLYDILTTCSGLCIVAAVISSLAFSVISVINVSESIQEGARILFVVSSIYAVSFAILASCHLLSLRLSDAWATYNLNRKIQIVPNSVPVYNPWDKPLKKPG